MPRLRRSPASRFPAVAMILLFLAAATLALSACGNGAAKTDTVATTQAAGAVQPGATVDPSASTRSSEAGGETYTPPQPEDFSALGWTEAFEKLNAKLSAEYAFTEWRRVDWRALPEEYGPRIAQAEAVKDEKAYYLALCEYIQETHDGHVMLKAGDDAAQEKMDAVERELAGGGYGLVATRLDDGSVVASWVKAGGPAELAGMKAGAIIAEWGGRPVEQAVAATSTPLSPNQPTDWRVEYERLRYLVRAPMGTETSVSFKNQGETSPETVTLAAIDDGLETLKMTDARSAINFGWPESMVEHETLDGNVGYIRIHAEIDLPENREGDHTPTLELFRRTLDGFIEARAPGIVVDLRGNSGGLDTMSARILGSFYDEKTLFEYQNFIVPGTGEFEIWKTDEETAAFLHRDGALWIEPAAKRYQGPVVALVDNACISCGEGLAMGIKNLPNGKVVGFTGTNGSFGLCGAAAAMPGGYVIKWPFGQSLNESKVVQIDSRDGQGGVVPDERVPMNLENALRVAAGEDVVLEYGLRVLRQMQQAR